MSAKLAGISEVRLSEPNGSVSPLSQQPETRYTKGMKMNEVTLNNPGSYVSPLTGVTYTVVKSYSERGSWDAEGNYAPVTVKQYSIYDGDKMVQFAFDETDIASSVAHYEGVTDGIYSSRFD